MLSLASWARRLSRLRDQQKTTWLTGFLAVLYYEFLWNLRKKKIIGLFILVFVIVTLSLALPPLLGYLNGVTLAPNPDAVSGFFNTFSGIFIFLIAVATTMNTISGEFETGSNLGYLLIQLVLNPSAVLNFCGVRFGPGGREGEIFTASSDTVATVALRALAVAIVYLAALLVVSWYAFRRSQIVESA